MKIDFGVEHMGIYACLLFYKLMTKELRFMGYITERGPLHTRLAIH